MTKKTALFAQHEQAGGKVVDFHGWLLPLHYGSQLDEHNQVRQDAGLFDVSHMTVVDFSGAQLEEFLQYLLANNVGKLKSAGRALYTAMLNEEGGIIDDLIVYKFGDNDYRLVLNAATRDKDLAWIRKQTENFKVAITLPEGLVNLAIQGPNAREKTQQALPESLREAAMALKPFACLRENGWQVARTGYTGEDGFEVILPETQAAEFWNALLAAGVKPCGLGARDTLRLEAGLNLYGADMDETVSPLESNIAWTVAFKPEERNFIGRAALEKQQAAGSHARLVGLLLNERGMLRGGQAVSQDGKQVGEIVSGGFSPLLKKSVAFARINTDSNEDCTVAMRGKEFPVEIVQLPFVRKGEVVFKLLKEVECHD